MNTPLTEQDLIQLNAYLDGELTAAERAEIETRIAEDERLQVELDSLRVTAAVLGMAERVRVPRSFTLDPAVYGRPERSKWWTGLGLGTLPMWATAGVTVLAVLVCGGIILLQSGMGGMATGAPVAQFEPAAEEAEEPEPTEEATEAADAMMEQAAPAMEEATEEAPMAALPAPTMAVPTASGGVGGGPPAATSTAEATSNQRNGIESTADTLAASAAAPGATEKRATTDTSEQPLPDEFQYENFTAVANTSTPTPTWIDGRWLGLPVKWVLVLAGVITLIAVGLLIRTALKRRSR